MWVLSWAGTLGVSFKRPPRLEGPGGESFPRVPCTDLGWRELTSSCPVQFVKQPDMDREPLLAVWSPLLLVHQQLPQCSLPSLRTRTWGTCGLLVVHLHLPAFPGVRLQFSDMRYVLMRLSSGVRHGWGKVEKESEQHCLKSWDHTEIM